MKKNNSLKLVLCVLGLSSIASLVGSISGTIAWYAYSTRALVSYTGTSVSSTTLLQIGIKSDIVIPAYETDFRNQIEDVTFEEDVYYENTDTNHEHPLYHNHYYFMKAGAGGMSSDVINAYLLKKGYTTNVLEPVSSYTYENLNLYSYQTSNDSWLKAEPAFFYNQEPWKHFENNGNESVSTGDLYLDVRNQKYYVCIDGSNSLDSSTNWTEVSPITGEGNPNDSHINGYQGAFYLDSNSGQINLRNRPATNRPTEDLTEAEITKYVEIPFVFRVLAADSSSSEYVGNHEIFISGVEAKARDENNGKINEAIRLYIDRSNGNNFVFNPTKTLPGKTKVAGVLNLSGVDGSGNGYFDYDNNVGSSTFGQEYLYGEYDFASGYNSLDDCLTQATQQDPAPIDFVDINNSGVNDHHTTFTSKHYPGVDYYFENLNGIIPHYAEYVGTGSVFPNKNPQSS